jgi:hypothetical protein
VDPITSCKAGDDEWPNTPTFADEWPKIAKASWDLEQLIARLDPSPIVEELVGALHAYDEAVIDTLRETGKI